MANGVDTSATIPCPHRPSNPPLRYDLPGPQIEPDAGFWIDGASRICVPTLEEVQAISEPPDGAPPVDTGTLPNRLVLNFKDDFPYDPSQPGNTGRLEEQLGVLFQLAEARDRPYPKTVGTLKLTPLSRFLQLQPVPFGAIFDTKHHDQVPIRNVVRQHERIVEVDATVVGEGRELARMFESETPGLYHRHALNWALFNRVDVSPPRQARIWAALDIAIYTALTAAWYYKWIREPYNLLVRPKEYALCVRKQNEFAVHYDRRVQNDGQDPNRTDLERECPLPSPGTPRQRSGRVTR